MNARPDALHLVKLSISGLPGTQNQFCAVPLDAVTSSHRFIDLLVILKGPSHTQKTPSICKVVRDRCIFRKDELQKEL